MLRAARAFAVVLGMTVALAGVAEALVRLAGVEHAIAARVSARMYPMRPGGGDDLFGTRVYDSVLQWRLRPDAWLPGRIGHINSLGFVGPEFEPRKRPGETRILALGDSVTYGLWACGRLHFCRDRPYPEALGERLRRRGGDRFTVIDAGVYGYSSLQGLRYYETYLGGLGADIVTAMFGWNDHGVATGIEGREPRTPALRAIAEEARRLATYRSLAGALALLTLPAEPAKPVLPPVYRPRVDLDDFAFNLEALVRTVRARGAHPVLVTEPVGPLTEPYRRNEVMQTWALNTFPDYDSYVAVHARYNERMREVASRLGVPLADADAEFERRGKTELFSPYDIVHPNEAGHALIAELIDERLAAEGWVP